MVSVSESNYYECKDRGAPFSDRSQIGKRSVQPWWIKYENTPLSTVTLDAVKRWHGNAKETTVGIGHLDNAT